MIRVSFQIQHYRNQLLLASLTIICLIFFSGCKEKDPCLSTPVSSPTPTTSTIVKNPVMIVLDASGSMKDDHPNTGKPKIDSAIKSVKAIINSPQASNLDISLTALGHRYENCEDNIEILQKKNKDILSLLPEIQKEAKGATPLTEAIKRAANEAFKGKDKNHEQTIVLLSDGLESCKKTPQGNDDLKAPFIEVESLKKDGFKFVLNIIGYGTEIADDKILEELAKVGGGTFYKPENADQLTRDLTEAVYGFGTLQVKKPSITISVKSWKLYESGNLDPIKTEKTSTNTDLNLWEENKVLSGKYRFCASYEDSNKQPSIFTEDIEIKNKQLKTIEIR